MDGTPDMAAWLAGPEGQAAIAEAFALPDTESTAAGERMRRRYGPYAPAVLTQAELRRRALVKFGADADRWLWTRAGLEQATRPAVAAHRARVLAGTGVRRVLDLGCGLGTDAAAFADAGLAVIAVERDERTAAMAAQNLAGRAEVRVRQGDATTLADELWQPGCAVFADPARRTGAGRSWNPADFSPPLDWALGLLERAAGDGGVGCLKLGPGLPYRLIPDHVGAEWVSHAGDLVEVALWQAFDGAPGVPGAGTRLATLLTAEGRTHRLEARDGVVGTRAAEVGDLLWEPEPAVIRAGAVDRLAQLLGAGRIAEGIAYLVGEGAPEAAGPYATAFVIRDVLPIREKVLRTWVREHEIGRLEIKKRGIEADPAALRRRLRPAGPHAATLLLTPTPAGARALVVDRVGSTTMA